MQPPHLLLRMVEDADLGSLFQHQNDPEANRLAGVPARSPVAFTEHWNWLRADETVLTRSIVADGELAGYLLSWPDGERRMVGYWLGRPFWGRRIATRALPLFLLEDLHRPLHAIVSPDNPASLRVLAGAGFVRCEQPAEQAEVGTGEPVLEYVLHG